MDGQIIGEDEKDVGVEVTDNNGVEHHIEMHKSNGEIYAHEQDGYPDDPSRRTPAESEHVHQARKFARYYVKLERGYDTMPPLIDPDRIDATRRAVEAMSGEEFERLFGDLHQQMASHHHDDVAPVVTIPGDAADRDAVFYCKNLFQGVDPGETDLAETAEDLAAEHGIDPEGESTAGTPVSEMTDETVETWTEFSKDLVSRAREEDVDLSEGTFVDGVSGVYVFYPTTAGEMATTDPDDPFERDPDVQIQLPPIDPGPLTEFQAYLAFNLRCQVRDSFVRMGVEPPEEFAVLGYGRYEALERYEKLAMYPEFHDPEADLAEGSGDDDGVLGLF